MRIHITWAQMAIAAGIAYLAVSKKVTVDIKRG